MSKENKNVSPADKADQAPDWLNENFFIEVLKQSENSKNVEIVSFKVTSAAGKNENYCSVLYRAAVEYRLQNELKKQSMIIKAGIEEDGAQKDLFKEASIFETEIAMYSVVVPKFEEMLRAAGDTTTFGPRMLYYSLQPREVIVFENLEDLGYEVIKTRAVNFEETKAVYTKISKWHALSFKIQLENPDFFKNFHKNNLGAMNIKENPAFNDGIVNFIELLDSQPDLVKYKPYFEPLVGKIVDYWQAALTEFQQNPQTAAYYVLCHGDFHHKNMMFKRNAQTGVIDDLLLLDFQQCYVGPLVNDVINSIYMIMDGETRLNNLDELFYFYFETFKNTLKNVNFQGTLPSMLDFRKEIMRHKGFELYLFTNFSPMMIALDEGKYDIGELMTDALKRKAVYKNPTYIEEVRKLLPKYLYMGYLEH